MVEETPDGRMKRLITGQFQKALPRRFYKIVEVSANNAVLLDGRSIKTPLKATLALPTLALASAVAAEWAAQVDVINPTTMPLTKLANTAIDRATSERQVILSEIVDYAGTDLVCYFATTPETLVQKQKHHWLPVLDWARNQLGATFAVAHGISHVAQTPDAIAAYRLHISALSAWRLTGVYVLTTLTGSALLSAMLEKNAISAANAWAATHVDEDFQIAHWGEDEEAKARRSGRHREFEGLVHYLELLSKN